MQNCCKCYIIKNEILNQMNEKKEKNYISETHMEMWTFILEAFSHYIFYCNLN